MILSIALFSLTLSHLHLTYSLIIHVRTHGWTTLRSSRFWNSRIGDWSGTVVLGQTDVCSLEGKDPVPETVRSDDQEVFTFTNVWAAVGEEMGRGFVACL